MREELENGTDSDEVELHPPPSSSTLPLHLPPPPSPPDEVKNVCELEIFMQTKKGIDAEESFKYPFPKPDKDNKNISCLWQLLEGFRSWLRSIDEKSLEEMWKKIEDTVEVVDKIVDILIAASSFFPAATPPLKKFNNAISLIKQKMKHKELKRIVLHALKQIFVLIERFLLWIILNFQKDPVELKKFNKKLGKRLPRVSKYITKDLAHAFIAGGGSAAAFLVTANALLPILGFGVNGIIAGSIAAGMMGPTTAAGGIFAGLQSAGVIGFSAVATGGIAAAGLLVGVGGVVAFKLVQIIAERKRIKKDEEKIKIVLDNNEECIRKIGWNAIL